MKALYKIIITFLYNNYCGVRTVRLFGKEYTATKASRLIFLYIVIVGLINALFDKSPVLTIFDGVCILLFIPQYLAGFTMIIVKEYKRLNKL